MYITYMHTDGLKRFNSSLVYVLMTSHDYKKEQVKEMHI